MNPPRTRLLKVLAIFGFVLVVLFTGALYWLHRAEENCWKQEAAEAFAKYGSLKKRTEILRIAGVERGIGSNPIEVIEKDPNGCSLGSNGQTILRFSFNDRNELAAIQVFRNYIGTDYHMALIAEKKN